MVRDMIKSTSALVDRRPRQPWHNETSAEELDYEELVKKCLKILGGKQRELFIWYYVEGLSKKECAQRRGSSLESLSAALARVHRKLRGRLGPFLLFLLLLLFLTACLGC